MFIRLSILIVFLLAMFWTVPALAVQPLDVYIEAETAVFQTEPDTFIAAGAAIDSGVVCATGDLINGDFHTSGPPDGAILTIRITKHFICDDGSGTFDLYLAAVIDKITGESTGNWVVSGGTGSYTALRGSGKLAGVPVVPGETVLDIYDGHMH